jgi:hypothetical protein
VVGDIESIWCVAKSLRRLEAGIRTGLDGAKDQKRIIKG